MEDSWDVQRDHIKLMRNLKRILRPNGTIVFSNNKHGFKMSFETLDELGLSAVGISRKHYRLILNVTNKSIIAGL